MADNTVVEAVGAEIYEIFVEEVGEIIQNLQDLMPKWQTARHDFKLLTDIRRSFHTLKGSGRMVTALGLGDFAWAYENMLNQVLSGVVEANDDLVAILNYGIDQLIKRQSFFLESCTADDEVKADVKRIEAFLAGEPLVLPSDKPVEPEIVPEPVIAEATAPVQVEEQTPVETSPEVLDFSIESDTPEVAATETTPEPEQCTGVLSIPDLIVLDFGTQDFISSLAASTVDSIKGVVIEPPTPAVIATVNSAEWTKFEHDGLIDFTAVLDIPAPAPEPIVLAAPVASASPAPSVMPATLSVSAPVSVTPAPTAIAPIPDAAPAFNMDDAEVVDFVGSDFLGGDPYGPVTQTVTIPVSVVVPTTTLNTNNPVVLEAKVVPVAKAKLALDQLPPLVADRENLLILKLFWEEVPDQLQELDQHFGALQTDPNNKDARIKLERVLHTLKGGARMAQLSAMGDIAHEAENSLADTVGAVPQPVLQQLQIQIDHINTLAEYYEAQTVAASEAGSAPVVEVVAPVPVITPVVKAEVIPAPVPVVPVEPVVPVIIATSQPSMVVPVETLPPVVVVTTPEKAPAPVPIKTVTPVTAVTPSALQQVPLKSVVLEKYDSLLEEVIAEQEAELSTLNVSQAPLAQPDEIAKPVEDDPLQSAAIQDQVRLPTVFLDRVIEHSSTMNVQQSRTHERIHSLGSDVGELGRTVARLRHLLRSLELETEARVHAGIVQQTQRAGFDPLEMDQYSELQRLSRALAESMNDLINIEGNLTDQLRKSEQGLMESIQAGRNIYQDLLSTRLIALNVLVPRLKRVVRQTAQELGKQAELVIHGDDCELDRHLLQRLTAPLEHLLRNALAHGIELPNEREAKGKAAQGVITLEVVQADAELVIRVIDDGAGLNRTALRRRAIEKGFIKPQENISDEKLDRLILQPGFTTATTVSQIAGRGVGMDVVFSEIKSLGGSLQIESVQGLGATFSLRVPFTMASNPVLFVSVQGQTYGLAMGNIQGLIRLSGEEVKKKLNQANEFLNFDGVNYPLRYLGQALKLRGLRDIQDDTMFPILFTLLNGQAKAWVVDMIVGRRDVVMQSLGVLFKNCALYSAATITPDGQVVLLPDLHELVRAPLPDSQPQQVNSGIVMKRANDQSRIMVVDDSITVRKVTEKFLVAESFAVETAKDGMEALEKLRDFNPDLLLLDIEMPRMDGFELLRHVRQTPEWKHLPVIMISSRTAEKHREHATALGASDFLGKPYQNQALLDKIRELLEGGTLLKGLAS